MVSQYWQTTRLKNIKINHGLLLPITIGRLLLVATLIALCSFQPPFQQSFSSPDDGSASSHDDNENQSSALEEEPVLQSLLRMETVSGEFIVELSWSVDESLNQTGAGGNLSITTFTLSFFDDSGFPQDTILYDFIVHNADGEVVERLANQHVDNFGSARHNVTFYEANPKAIQVDVVIKSAGSSPVLLNDTATFEIAVVPEFSGVMLTIVASFLVVTIAMIIMQRSMLSRRGNYWIR